MSILGRMREFVLQSNLVELFFLFKSDPCAKGPSFTPYQMERPNFGRNYKNMPDGYAIGSKMFPPKKAAKLVGKTPR